MIRSISCSAFAVLLALPAMGQTSTQATLPYSPSLDVTSMDKTIDPCVDFYTYSCGGWQKKNPIPADQTSWDVYAKLYQDNPDWHVHWMTEPEFEQILQELK